MKILLNKKNLAMLIVAATLFSGCNKDDNPLPPATPTSRLFVSNADIDPAVANLSVYSPADAATLGTVTPVATTAPDGNGITYDAAGNVGFQVGRANKQVKVFTVSSGNVAVASTFTDAAMSSGRGAAYDAANKVLYVANNSDSTIRVYINAPNLSGAVTANKVFKLDGQPWGLTFANGSLMVLIDMSRKEVQLFNNVNSIASGAVTPSNKITIPSATRLHGLTYDASSDVLLVTEIGLAAAPPIATIPAFNEDGGIYIIEGALAKFAANSAVTPNRTIIGSSTMLGNPVDIAFDARAGKKLIYIAEKAQKKILVFKLTDNGNVAPASVTVVSTLPESLHIDARN